MSAPLQYSLILPSGQRTMVDMRFRVELNSQMFRISYSYEVPRTLTKTDFGLRVYLTSITKRNTGERRRRTWNWYPINSAPATSAASSGLLAWYVVLPSLTSGMTV